MASSYGRYFWRRVITIMPSTILNPQEVSQETFDAKFQFQSFIQFFRAQFLIVNFVFLKFFIRAEFVFFKFFFIQFRRQLRKLYMEKESFYGSI